MNEKKIRQTLVEKRAMHYNDFMGSLRQLKKKIADIEARIKASDGVINFSANTDILEDATILWKSSYRLFQIDELLEALHDDAQKLNEPPQNVPETHDVNKCVEPPDKKT